MASTGGAYPKRRISGGYEGFTKGSEQEERIEIGDEVIEDWTCHEDCPVRMLDEQSGESRSFGGSGEASQNPTYSGRTVGTYLTGVRANMGGLGDFGGASRFFYCAKASRAEREAGLFLKNADCVLCKKGKEHDEHLFDDHPTVKPIDLMRYLVKLVTPPGGLVLDPFLGSGTTLLACRLEGLSGLGIERDTEYEAIIRGRLNSIPPPLESFA